MYSKYNALKIKSSVIENSKTRNRAHINSRRKGPG